MTIINKEAQIKVISFSFIPVALISFVFVTNDYSVRLEFEKRVYSDYLGELNYKAVSE